MNGLWVERPKSLFLRKAKNKRNTKNGHCIILVNRIHLVFP